MKKSEFTDKIEAYKSRTFGVMFLATAIFIVVLCFSIFYVDLGLKQVGMALMPTILLTCVVCLILSGAFMYFIFASAKSRAQKFGVDCKHCSRILNPHTVVIATGNCPNCGERVLDPE